MDPRYEDTVIKKLFSPQLKLERWRQVELAYMQMQVEDGTTPQEALDQANATKSPMITRVRAREQTVGHDLVAFLIEWMHAMPDPTLARWVHHGLTSSDIVDPAHHAALFESGERVSDLVLGLHRTLLELSNEHRLTYRLGRTHGQAAEPTTFGHQMLVFAQMVGRAQRDFTLANQAVMRNKLPGAVGTGALGPVDDFSTYVAGTQVIPRDIQARWALSLIPIVLACEALAMEIRLSSRHEVGEVAEGSTRIGSSAMPHKRNPITSEKVSGLARVARALIGPIMETVTLHHDRDISNSSVERTAVVDLAHIAAHCVSSMTDVMRNLQVFKMKMADNLQDAGEEPYSSLYLFELIELGVDYVSAHAMVKRSYDGSGSVIDCLFNELKGYGIPEEEIHGFYDQVLKKANPVWMVRNL